MTLPDYITATRTTDLVNTVRHAALGLISEVGEVYGVLAKIERGDKIDRAERMTAELGDVAWYLARLCDLTSVAAPDIGHDCPKWATRETVLSASRRIAHAGHATLADADNFTAIAAEHCWAYWSQLCQIEGLDPATVLAANLAKLRDRQARRVLQGDGDHR